MSTSAYEAQQELENAFSEDRKENFAPPRVKTLSLKWYRFWGCNFVKSLYILTRISLPKKLKNQFFTKWIGLVLAILNLSQRANYKRTSGKKKIQSEAI